MVQIHNLHYFIYKIPRFCKTDTGQPGYAYTMLFGGRNEDRDCKFPFEYNDRTYTDCSLGWCYTENPRNLSSTWALVKNMILLKFFGTLY